MTEPRPVERLGYWVPVTDEWLIDTGNASPEVIARYEARQAELRAYLRALPWRVKVSRRLRWRYVEARYRLAHAVRALRGIECERD